MASVRVDDVIIPLLAKSVAINVPEERDLVYCLDVRSETDVDVVMRMRGVTHVVAQYSTVKAALENFKADVIRAEMRRRAAKQMVSMARQLVDACTTPLGDDADVGL